MTMYKKIKELPENQKTTTVVLLALIEEKETRAGKPYCELTLSDGETQIQAKLWNNAKADVKVEEKSLITAELYPKEYQGALSYELFRYGPAPEDCQITDYVKYLYTRALYSNMPVPFEGRKIHGAYPIQEGPDRGMCRAFHITIKRNALRPDGQPSRSPWNITISNGVAQAQSGGIEGTFFEKSGTFKQTAYVYMNLTDVDFLDCMDRLNTYIREYTRLSADKLIPEGIKALKEVYERSSYQASATPQTDGQQAQRQYTEQQTPPPAQYQVQSQQTQTVQTPQPTQPAQTPLSARQSTPELHPTTLLIQSTFQALEGGKSIAQCMVKGRTYNVFFDFMSNELIEAQMSQRPITLNLYLDSGNRFRCHSITQAS